MAAQATTPTTEVGERIFWFRDARGWSQIELARQSGVSREAIIKIEGGKSSPKLPTLRRLARAFNTTVEEITGEAQE